MELAVNCMLYEVGEDVLSLGKTTPPFALSGLAGVLCGRVIREPKKNYQKSCCSYI